MTRGWAISKIFVNIETKNCALFTSVHFASKTDEMSGLSDWRSVTGTERGNMTFGALKKRHFLFSSPIQILGPLWGMNDVNYTVTESETDCRRKSNNTVNAAACSPGLHSVCADITKWTHKHVAAPTLIPIISFFICPTSGCITPDRSQNNNYPSNGVWFLCAISEKASNAWWHLFLFTVTATLNMLILSYFLVVYSVYLSLSGECFVLWCPVSRNSFVQ
jgi:hypothetical protein